MYYGLEATLWFQNASRRDNAFATVQNWVATHAASFYVEPHVGSYEAAYKGRGFALAVLLKIFGQAERDALWNQVVALLAGAGGPMTGAWIFRFDFDPLNPGQGFINPQQVTF